MSATLAPVPHVLLAQGDVLGRIASGDRDAFAQLYDLSIVTVFNLIRYHLTTTADTEAMTREVYLEAWRTAAQHAPAEVDAVRWVITLAHRHVIAHS
ncbi:hypothetical protein GCM10025867_07510 [Frondihabitans sucicola]|uniref:RNA polymerase sigma-70 region 2 domain-containing protein n=1 Tax=Frondihabitans sucicola TaxID=1268041 RepID=A0ABM8GJF3_9MICO|nr:hypothetical protein [Frondihabitans sucicola]BDZ48510.1 hypothetical protein GCM10025867_07510 [Frondihabitans sucicola]